MKRESVADAPQNIAEVLEHVELTGEPVAFEQDGRRVAVLVSDQDYRLLDRLREEEDLLDAEDEDRVEADARQPVTKVTRAKPKERYKP